MDNRYDNSLKSFIEAYGNNPQIDMCIEEMSELTKALLKYRRINVEDLIKAKDNIIDELADVCIMCRQMELIFNVGKEVEKRIDYKVKRQEERLKAYIQKEKEENKDDIDLE